MTTNPTQEKKTTRKQHKASSQAKETSTGTKKELRQAKKAEKKQRKKQKIKARRVIPIWLRVILVLLFCAAALLGGLMVGYGIIGDGKPMDALEWETWQHIIDIVKKSE
ncbi:DNA-directed RNA polymerase subunit beta [Thalassobacillus hwangdonensis]|uniref:DNA-directed RNA polymerase subunit beta n=1 Tax=Thalassobacillus hwangdonensis TaxID=546108 RepID=A0ABW3L3R3_9BACI